MDTLIEKTYLFAKAYHAKDVSGHDFRHIERVYQNACRLLEEAPEADGFIVKMSALLHDIDDHKLGGDGKQALGFLSTLGMEKARIDAVLSTVDAIGFSKTGDSPAFDTIEQKLLSDADKLDAMGAMGICRTVQFGASRGRPLFDKDIFPKENLTKEEYKELSRKENTSINHFFNKLLKLKGTMQTEAGKEEAEKRHRFMVDFLAEFFEEQNLGDWIEYLRKYQRIR